MRGIWLVTFRVGITAFLAVVAIAFVAALGQILDFEDWPLREGEPFTQRLGAACMWVAVGAGLVLLVPTIMHLWRHPPSDRLRTVVWTLSFLLLPFVTPYGYFALYMRTVNPQGS